MESAEKDRAGKSRSECEGGNAPYARRSSDVGLSVWNRFASVLRVPSSCARSRARECVRAIQHIDHVERKTIRAGPDAHVLPRGRNGGGWTSAAAEAQAVSAEAERFPQKGGLRLPPWRTHRGRGAAQLEQTCRSEAAGL